MTYCSGEQGDHSCVCSAGVKISSLVDPDMILPTFFPDMELDYIDEEDYIVYGRRKMAIDGEEMMYCERENLCIYNHEVDEPIAGPLSSFHGCLDMNSWESYEISSYFPLDGEEMREGGSLAYCSDYIFDCLVLIDDSEGKIPPSRNFIQTKRTFCITISFNNWNDEKIGSRESVI